jgi:hypothetical protein
LSKAKEVSGTDIICRFTETYQLPNIVMQFFPKISVYENSLFAFLQKGGFVKI